MRTRFGILITTIGTILFFCGCAGKHALSGNSIESGIVAKGYKARACGLDMNRNGIIGEPADRLVGDGKTKDVDGDGVEEDIIYVDSENGSDRVGKGTPERPYKSIQYALSVADGPEDGAEDIICISGVFAEELTIIKGGVPGHYVRDGFQYPSNPAMIVGWDRDGDGEYPPYDKDDIAVLDGRGALEMAINNNPNARSYLEFGHLTITNYGHKSKTDSIARNCGAFRLRGHTAGPQSHIYIHDVEIRQVNKAVASRSGTIIVNCFPSGDPSVHQPMSHFAMINNLVDEFAGYFARGAGWGGERWRWQNNTLKMYGPEGSEAKVKWWAYVTAWKIWSPVHGLEILDNVIDGNPAAWNPTRYVVGTMFCQRSQDWTIRGNVFLNLHVAIIAQPYAEGLPQDRPIDKIVIDRNIIRNTYTGWKWPPYGLIVQGGPKLGSTVESLTITNNDFRSSVGFKDGMSFQSGNDEGPHTGTITITGNTIYGPFDRAGIYNIPQDWRIAKEKRMRKFPLNKFIIRNNTITNVGPGKSVLTTYAPDNWVAGGNTYDSGAGFSWDGVEYTTLAEWQKATGQDADSEALKP